MSPLFLVLALIIQGSFVYADTDADDKLDETQINELDEIPEPLETDIIAEPDDVVEDARFGPKDFMDMFVLTTNSLFPSSSAAKMTVASNSSQTCEEQIENIKKCAEDIANDIKVEVVNLLSFALALNATANNNTSNDRSKRSVETPMASSQMVMRLLNHIKSNNEYQNIAIEKMMSAQEIADKFGIEFNPDPEIISELATASNVHAQEMTTLLKDTCDATEVEFVPVNEEPMRNTSYYSYMLHPDDIETSTKSPFEYCPDVISKRMPVEPKHSHLESQIPAPHHNNPVSQRSNFYDPYPSDFYPDMSPAIFIIDEPEPEPELVGEEVEETVTTKLFVEKGDEPGTATVNQVTTYSVSEKSHFKTPQIEKLPEQFQYCFFLM